ncbi:glycoside hydrolase 5 family protein [Niabella ginsenosidivorans]|nr:hypothetical protein [Niabella ginsenosidivorans]
MRPVLPLASFILAVIFSISFFSCSKTQNFTNIPTPVDSSITNPPKSDSVPATLPLPTGNLFLYGSNMGYYGANWPDEKLAEILIGSTNTPGVGVNSLRPALYESFLAQWGLTNRLSTFKYYQQLGAKDNVVFLNGPSDAHKDKTKYCATHESETFANLYEPIWNQDGSVNANNYYAKYVYDVVKTYGPYVKFWEVWNEPDFTNNWYPNDAWVKADPDPCDLVGFYAPIQSYVRMLRITHEIVKKLDPTDLVCLGGIGYEGFLDAVLRNTDNPKGGAVATAYPDKGGALFDCVSFHIYPMYYLGNNKNSDAAAKAITDRKNTFESVLTKYQYANKKDYIITECNIPRKALSGYIGSDEAQRNFMIKAAVSSQKANIRGIYMYQIAETETYDAATDPYQTMGFYQKITSGPYNVVMNSSGISWRTTSRLLKDRLFDKTKTQSMSLPSNIDGGAFYSASEKNYIYVLWAKASGNSESVTSTYTFPASFGIKSTSKIYSWDEKAAQATNKIALTGAPVFIKP